MARIYHSFAVTGQKIHRADFREIVSDSQNFCSFRFLFSPEWDGLVKQATFTVGGEMHRAFLADDGTVPDGALPELPVGSLIIGIVGTDSQGTVANTVYSDPIGIVHGATADGAGVQPIPLTYGERILQQAEQAVALANQVKESAEAGEYVCATGPRGVSITGVLVNDDGTLHISYSDDTSEDIGENVYQAMDALLQQAEEAADDAADEAQRIANTLLNGITLHDADSAAHPALTADLARVEAIARGKANAHVFNSVTQMNNWLAVSDNRAGLTVGDNLYIRATDVPDYWWDGTQAQELETEHPQLDGYYTAAQVDALLPRVLSEEDYEELVEAGTVEAGKIYYVTVT